jgi:prepilin-type N-terminal cleavage/methylation domain-containing protein
MRQRTHSLRSSQPWTRWSRRPRAFTLIEVVVVAIVMAIMFGTVAIMMGDSYGPEARLREATRRLAGRLIQVRGASIEQERWYRVTYDFDDQVARFSQLRELEPGQEPPEEPKDDDFSALWSVEFGDVDAGERYSPIWLTEVQSYSGQTYQRGRFSVDIQPRGSSVGHVVHVTNREGEYFSVELNPMTGTARVYDYEKRVAELKKD